MKAQIEQLRNADGLCYEAVDNHTFARHGFAAQTDAAAWERARTLAGRSGHSHTLYRSMPMNRIERVPNPEKLPKGRWDR